MFDKKQRIFFAVLVTIITLAGLKLFYSSAGNKSTTQNQTFEAPESDEDAVGFDPKTNTLRIGINGRLNSKDPLNSNSNLEKFFIYHVRQGLSKFNIRGAAELSDGVTASYVNPNTIQFTLGGKHAWITGSKITAADYVYSWKRALLIKGFKSGPLLLIKNARQFIESKGKAKLGIRAAKNNVFEVEFSAADKTILSQRGAATATVQTGVFQWTNQEIGKCWLISISLRMAYLQLSAFRAHNENPAEMYTANRDRETHYGMATVNFPKTRVKGSLNGLKVTHLKPSSLAANSSTNITESDT